MPSIESIVILGTGNVAGHLAKAFYSNGIEISQVYGRNPEKAKALAGKYSAEYCSRITDLRLDADAYFFCLSDQVIQNVLVQTSFSDQLLLHSSGTLDMKVFHGYSKSYGVFYPLQTFSTDREVEFSNIPVCIEAKSEEIRSLLTSLAERISKDVRFINSEQRAVIHVAAVFSCNFSNHMYTVAEKILEDQGVGFDILKPLILETAKKAIEHPASEVQTGPAKRNDEKIIQEHLKILEKYPEHKELYELISRKIQDFYNI